MGNYCDFNINTGFIAEDGSILFERADRALIHMITRQQETLQALGLIIIAYHLVLISSVCSCMCFWLNLKRISTFT